MTDDQIKHMVDRFLNWRLPENWKPDGGITFEKFGNKGTPHQYARNPVGTNLLDADQAEAMVRYMIAEMPEAVAPDWPPQRSAVGLTEGRRQYGSTGQLFEVKGGRWVRVLKPLSDTHRPEGK